MPKNKHITCPVCRRKVTTVTSGAMRTHKRAHIAAEGLYATCRGSRAYPEDIRRALAENPAETRYGQIGGVLR